MNYLNTFGETSEIPFFLMGAMTIVELIDSHHGIAVVDRQYKNPR